MPGIKTGPIAAKRFRFVFNNKNNIAVVISYGICHLYQNHLRLLWPNRNIFLTTAINMGKMKESIKGALLSALVYPGLGQLILGAKFKGISFAVLTTAGLLVIIYRMTIRIYRALDLILPALTGNFGDLPKILTILDQSTYPDWSGEIISLIVVVICWGASIIHAYWLGCRLDRT